MNKNKHNFLLKEINKLEAENSSFLHLTVNENQLSKTASSLLSSKLSERYYFGAGQDGIVDFGSYMFVGMPAVENIVSQAENALKKMTGAKVVNLSTFSGLHAMMCAILSCTKPGDVVLSIPFEDGGHGATKGIIESLGRKHAFASFDKEKLQFDVEETAKIFKDTLATAIYIDISVHLNPVNIKPLKKALGKKALVIFDASHSLGLILGGTFCSPFKEGADVVCGNTHKTFAGPQRGVIMFKEEKPGNEADWLIKTTFVSSVHTAELMALAVSILEFEQFGHEYATKVIANSQALADAFAKLGYEVRKSNDGGYSNNEQVHLFVDKLGDRVDLYKRLVRNNISTNFMQVLGGRSFARIGTQEITRRGMDTRNMATVANLVDRALRGEKVKDEVVILNKKFDKIYYSFDER